MDFSSPKVAEQLFEIKQKAAKDEQFKQRLLACPEETLTKHGILLDKAKLTLEDIPGYGLYIAFKLPENKADDNKIDKTNADTSFTDQHYMDCHHY
jgi:hypothetical protein